MKGYHKSMGPARCVMKVDLMKAYDSVQWDFVDAKLIKIGFPRTVIDWIMVCVTSCPFSRRTRLTDFRPISCCNIVYKCMAKILAGRIKVVLPSLVGPYQTAFISFFW